MKGHISISWEMIVTRGVHELHCFDFDKYNPLLFFPGKILFSDVSKVLSGKRQPVHTYSLLRTSCVLSSTRKWIDSLLAQVIVGMGFGGISVTAVLEPTWCADRSLNWQRIAKSSRWYYDYKCFIYPSAFQQQLDQPDTLFTKTMEKCESGRNITPLKCSERNAVWLGMTKTWLLLH